MLGLEMGYAMEEAVWGEPRTIFGALWSCWGLVRGGSAGLGTSRYTSARGYIPIGNDQRTQAAPSSALTVDEGKNRRGLRVGQLLLLPLLGFS